MKFLIAFFIFSVGLLSAQPRPINRTEAQARRIVDSLYTLVKNGSDISKLALTNSEDPGTNFRGGMLLNIPYGRLVPEFDNEVVKLDAGMISQPFRTIYGYHFLQVIEKTATAYTVRHILIKFRE
ncbi:hypothetical protein CNR22_16325 [Sphingobacteriaceae bacterium]|nr:hypothetical protein CNR22_16325 [Sphingobacteriaceae bacterium]